MSEDSRLTTDADRTPAGKSAEEYRMERLTWFALVGVLLLGNILPDWINSHHGFAPLLAGGLLFASGIYQHRRGWRVSYPTWVASTLLIVGAGFSFVSRPDLDLSLLVALVAVGVIARSIFTRTA